MSDQPDLTRAERTKRTLDSMQQEGETIPVCPMCGDLRRDITLFGVTRSGVRAECPHQEADRAREEARRRLEERTQEDMAKLREQMPVIYRDTRLSDLDDRSCSRAGRAAAVRYVESLADRMVAGEGLTLAGNVGTGKTMIACAIANEAARMGYRAHFITATAMLEQLKVWDEAQRTMGFLKAVPLLVIDDFGQERVTEWTASAMFDLIDARHQARRATIVTSNLGPAGLLAHYVRSLTSGKDQMPPDQAALTCQRLLSRLRQRNASALFEGEDQRAVDGPTWLNDAA